MHVPSRIHDLAFPVNRPSEGLINLSKIENPHPGDPPPPRERSEDEDSDMIDWDESGSFAVRYAAAYVGPPQFTPFPPHIAATAPSEEVRIVCCDVIGTLVVSTYLIVR